MIKLVIIVVFLVKTCVTYKILGFFPQNGRSHHIFFSSLVEELATRNHNVTVVNYFPVKQLPNLRQISLLRENESNYVINVENYLKMFPSNILLDFALAYDMAKVLEILANDNCRRLFDSKDIRNIIERKEKFDVVIVEQFVSDCGLALAYQLNAPTVGIAAHVLVPWTYSRLGLPNNPAFVPNYFFASGTRPNVINKIKSILMNFLQNMYYKYVTQSKDYEIVQSVYPDTPDLESLGQNMTLVMLNQYYPLTGARLQGPNVIEIGGMHINSMIQIADKELATFLDDSKNGVIIISFGTVANNLPRNILNEIVEVIKKSDRNFIWKSDQLADLKLPKNVLVKKWLQQSTCLCHPNVVAFVTHSGMLSLSEAMHCGVPVVSVPLFADQFTNAASAVESGLGVTIDINNLDEKVLAQALETVLQESYQRRGQYLSKLWRDRPLSPMDTAVYWIEYVSKYGHVNMKPATVDLPLYQYLWLDVILVLVIITMTPILVFKFLRLNKKYKITKKYKVK